ncbi:ABC transporter substrate-binding protein [Nonomuraea sp. NPDC052265]|uniref:ABC transporter substrate-binding protein n=1 Tax=Nonomuraea sp. NPDC052265 TaxID=3364374 RepID=UPI0037C7E333
MIPKRALAVPLAVLLPAAGCGLSDEPPTASSGVDCAVNAPCPQSRIVSVQGTGVDPTCFESPAVSPVNTGPYLNMAINLYYASEVLKRDKVCMFPAILGNTNDAYGGAVKSWTALTGKKLTPDDRTVEPGSDPTPFVLRARREGCQAVLYNGTEPMAIAWMKVVRQQDVTGIDWLMTTAPYTEAVAEALGPDGDGMYANAEFEPFTEADSPALKDWRALMTSKNVPLTSFRQAARHFSDRAGKIVRLKDGAWRVVTPDWRAGVAALVDRDGEGVSLEEALATYTIAGARQDFAEGWKGTLTPGKVADLCVSAATADEDVVAAPVDLTVFGGRVVWCRS